MAKKVRKPVEELLIDLLKVHVPEEYLEYFEMFELRNKADCYELVLHEKEHLIPETLKDKEVVLDGFTDPISILTHTFSLKKMYLVIYRRRWKEKGKNIHYSNSYDLHPDSIKITPQYADFLKEYDRISSHQH